MGDPKGFLTIRRASPRRLPVLERITTWQEFYEPTADEVIRGQAARCMDCGVPFCQGDTGCPVQNVIPEWNDLVFRGRWREALDALHATNNFPELTGRLCPAPCEPACVLTLVDQPVTIRSIEQTIADRGFAEGWITPVPPARETGLRVAIVGSGPAGLAAAQELRRCGHAVTVFEKDDRIGGLLRYGIPDFKLQKDVLERRLTQLEAEGVDFVTGVDVGRDASTESLRREFDAILLAIGAPVARELPIPGRDLEGVHLAMDYLVQQNRRIAGDAIPRAEEISAAGKRVVIIGGGDTGADCLGTCHRQGATEVHQLQHLPAPPEERDPSTPWPLWPMQLRVSHAHEEGGTRHWNVSTTSLAGHRGRVRALQAMRVTPAPAGSGSRFVPVPDGEVTIPADLVLIAIGFSGPVRDGLVADLGVRLDAAGNIATDVDHATSVDGVFAAGDARRGASLIVWAIREGRDAARAIDRYVRRRAEWRGPMRGAGAAAGY